MIVFCNIRYWLRMRMLRADWQRRRERARHLADNPAGILFPLNQAHQSKRTRELAELVVVLQQIERVEIFGNEIERRMDHLRDDRPGPYAQAPRNLYARANKLLRTCCWRPIVRPSNERTFSWRAATEQMEWENCFVFWLLNIRSDGDLSRVRTCRNCGRWFFAVAIHQTSCSNRCRQQFQSKNDDFKEKRRLYMRQYRRNEAALDRATKKSARKQITGRVKT